MKTRRILSVILIITLVMGLLSSGFGISVMALKKLPAQPDEAETNDPATVTEPEETYQAPTAEYSHLKKEVTVKDNVKLLTQEDSRTFINSIESIENKSSYSRGDYVEIILPEQVSHTVENVNTGDYIFLQGEKNATFGGDQIFYVNKLSTYGGKIHMEVQQPYLEDVFESLEICASDLLTHDNLVNAYFAEGVSAYFGNVETAMPNVAATSATEDMVLQKQAQTESPQVQRLGANAPNHSQASGGDLIVEINYDFNKNKKKKDDDDGLDKSFGIQGQFGIRDLTAHLVCDMPSALNFEELYVGVSGQFFVDVDVYGKIEAKAEMEADKKDCWLFNLEGLREKRFPISVFQFQGTTAINISNSTFDKAKDTIVPTIFVIVYADWEGKISLEANAGFEVADSFNNGLQIFRNGEANLSFVDFPYTEAYDAEDEDGFFWEVNFLLDADTDITLIGGSVVFYIAGINIAEVSVARIGVEAQCDLAITANSEDGVSVLDNEDTKAYVRGYLKMIEVKVKLKVEGKHFLNKLSADINFAFTLLDITLFSVGSCPDKYKPKMPISSMRVPDKFDSVTSLVCDVSGSMNSTVSSGETKLQAAQAAGHTVISTTQSWAKNDPDHNYGIGIVQFSDNAKTVSVPHIDYRYLDECMDIIKDGGGTSIYAGIDTGIAQLEAVDANNKVMILMTDGQDYNTSKARKSAEDAAQKGIKIYTIGFGNDVDEVILQDIAEITGGEYRFADTENIMGIIGSFMYAQSASNSTVITESQGTVSEGESTEAIYFTVEENNGDLMTSTAWPGSFLDTILIDPNGRVVDDEYPGAVTDESQIPSTITVKNPIPGEWSVKIKGVETSYEDEPYYTIVTFKEAENQRLNTQMEDMEVLAAYCAPIGLFVSMISVMLLFCLKKKKETADNMSN